MRLRRRISPLSFVSCGVLLAAASGCSSGSGATQTPSQTTSPTPEGGAGTEGGTSVTSDGGTDSGHSDGATAAGTTGTPGAGGESVAGAIQSGCTLAQQVNANLTLSPDVCVVYDAPDGLIVGAPAGTSSPVLTIQAGVAVAFGPAAQLSVGGNAGPGGLVVQGTASSPVVFTSDATTPAPGEWGGVDLQPQTLTTSSIAGLVVQYGGNPSNAGPLTDPTAAAFLFDGTGGDFTVPLSNVTVSNNGGTGIAFAGQHTGPGATSSGTLTVTDWAAAADPFFIYPDAVGLLSTVTLSTGTTPDGYVDVVELSTDPNVVDVAETWPSIAPLSYVLGQPTYGANQLNVVPQGAQPVILTIAAPNTLHFGGQFVLNIDPDGSGLAGLQANGTSAAPITFGALGSGAGSWNGIQLNYGTLSNNSSLQNVTIDSAGGFDLPPAGALLVQGTDDGNCVPGPTLNGITFTNLPAGAYGILALDVTGSTADTWSTENTFPSGSPGVYTPSVGNQCIGF